MMDNLSIQPLAVIIVHGIAMISSYFRKKKILLMTGQVIIYVTIFFNRKCHIYKTAEVRYNPK